MGKCFYFDLLERVSWTFVQAGAASLLVTGFSVTALEVAAAAGGAAVLKCLIAARAGNRDAALPSQ